MPTRKLPHIMSGIELQMDLDNLNKEGFQPEEESIAEDPLKPSPFDAGADSALKAVRCSYMPSHCMTSLHCYCHDEKAGISTCRRLSKGLYSLPSEHMRSRKMCVAAAKLDPFSSESEDEGVLCRPAGVRTQRTRSEADKTLSNQRLSNQKAGHFEPSESLADDNEIPFDPAGHAASRKSMSAKPPMQVRLTV